MCVAAKNSAAAAVHKILLIDSLGDDNALSGRLDRCALRHWLFTLVLRHHSLLVCTIVASPVADNKIYIASEEGVVVVLDGGEELKVLASNKLDGQILATPAIVDGKIYVRTANYLYGFGR